MQTEHHAKIQDLTDASLMIVDDDAFKSRQLTEEVTLALALDRLHLLPLAISSFHQ